MPMLKLVAPHDPRWAQMAAREAAAVAMALGANVVTVHHIGSTAIPGIHAKPIIDLMPEVADIRLVDARNDRMVSLGYECMGEMGIPGRRYFRKEDDECVRTHHVHTFAAGCDQVIRHLAFRDFLRAHPAWAQQYCELKRRLVAECETIDQYIEGKDGFIRDVDRRAAEWLSRTDALER